MKRFYKGLYIFLCVPLIIFCLCCGNASPLKIYSRVFEEGSQMSRLYSCDGSNISPPLAWRLFPQDTDSGKKIVSFALICEDPDAPSGTWVHWVLYNIPADVKSLPEGFGSQMNQSKKLSDGSEQGINSWGVIGYGGFCPPPGKDSHRYYFKIYALDTKLHFNSMARVTRELLEKTMKGHVVAKDQLMGRFQRD